jgi:hypothetical protein
LGGFKNRARRYLAQALETEKPSIPARICDDGNLYAAATKIASDIIEKIRRFYTKRQYQHEQEAALEGAVFLVFLVSVVTDIERELLMVDQRVTME